MEQTRSTNNGELSLFHRLPAELREIIYLLVFPPPGSHLHIWRRPSNLNEPFCSSSSTVFKPYPEGKEVLQLEHHNENHQLRYTHVQCQVPHDDDYNYASTKLSGGNAVGRPVWNWLERERHGRCFHRPVKIAFPFGLVVSCRLIYQETAALLYGDNTFYFHDAMDLNDFVLRLGSRSKRALQHIRLYCDVVNDGSPLCKLGQEAADRMETLLSLKVTIASAVQPQLTQTPRFASCLRAVEVVIGPPYQKHLAGHTAHRNRPDAAEIENWILNHRTS